MLSCVVRFHTYAPVEEVPEWWDGETCQFCTRRCKLACSPVNALPCCAFPHLCSCGEKIPDCWNPAVCHFRTRRRRPVCQEAYALPCCAFRARRWKLSCKRMNGFLYSPARAFHFLSVIIKGVWGGAPWLRAALALFTTSFLSCKGVWGPAPMFQNGP